MSSSTVLIATPYGFIGDVGLPWNNGGSLAKEIHNLRTLQSGDYGREVKITTPEVKEDDVDKVEKVEDLQHKEVFDVAENSINSEEVQLEIQHERPADEDDDEYEDIDEEEEDDDNDDDEEDEKKQKLYYQVNKLVANRKSFISKISKASDFKQKTLSMCQSSKVKTPSSPSSSSDRSSTSQKTHHSCYSSSERLQKIRETVEHAIREHKTFTVYGAFPTVREALKQRGWVEKEKDGYQKKSSLLSFVTSQDDSLNLNSVASQSSLINGETKSTESMLVSRLLRNVKVDFLWTMRSDPINWQEINKKQLVNRFPRAYFTTKVGLCNYLQQMHWFCEKGVSHTLFPRCYNICHPDEMNAFKDDFRLTACLGLLKWLVSTFHKRGKTAIKSINGKIPFTAIQFAISRCSEYLSAQTHEDIDKSDFMCTWDHQWDQFLTWYYMVVHDNILFIEFEEPSIESLYDSAKTVLGNMKNHWPQFDLDGVFNIWIIKPGAKSRGRGIQLMNKLEQIFEKVNPAVMKESRYVVQKYIERPLLIHCTKFDIRQWFLVTCAQPLTIWMYKESYLRFCSQPFNLHNFHESVHLCNNAVQCKYKNGKRDPALPDENMWDCYTFQTYLRTIGHADMWEKCIYPGMRESIICALLSAQEHMDRRKNCFELFGADFMLTEDFSPWLIEINSCPCMAASTSVTARMCAQCLEDVVKVVVDRRYNSSASTGMFELVYRQRVPRAPPYLGMSLSVRGTKILKNNGIQKSKTKSPRQSPGLTSPSTISSRTSSRQGSPASRNSSKDSPRVKSPISASSTKGSPEASGQTIKSPVSSNHNEHASENDSLAKRISEFTGPVIVDMIGNLANQLEKKKTPSHKSKITKNAPIHVITEKDVLESELTICTDPSCLSKENDYDEKVLERSFGEIVPLAVEIAGKRKKEATAAPDDKYSKNDGYTDHSVQKKVIMEEQEESEEQIEKESKESKNDQLSMKELEVKKKQMCVSWKNSSDAEKSIQFFNEWKQKLDRTRASCEDMLYKLKMFRENENIKPKYYPINRGINWEGENANKPTISDILKKLSQAHPEREVIMFKNSRQLPDTESKDNILKRKPCYLNMLIEDDLQYASRRSEKSLSDQSSATKLPLTPQIYNPSIDKHNAALTMKGILPHIKQKNKLPNSNSMNCNGRKLDNFYAIGMSLKSLQAIHSQKDHLLLPLESDNNTVTPVLPAQLDG